MNNCGVCQFTIMKLSAMVVGELAILLNIHNSILQKGERFAQGNTSIVRRRSTIYINDVVQQRMNYV
jgi:hypothetical protein